MIAWLKRLNARLRWRGWLLLLAISLPIAAIVLFQIFIFFALGSDRQFVDWDDEAQQIRSVEYIRSNTLFYQTPLSARNARYYWLRNLDGVPFDFITFEIAATEWKPELIYKECAEPSKRDRFSVDYLPAVNWWPAQFLGKDAVSNCQNLSRSPYEYQIYEVTKDGITTVWAQGYYTLW
jgi:hypothetical protein